MTDLHVTGAILFECTMKEFKFSWETFLVTDRSNSLYQGEEHKILHGQVVA